MQKYIIVVVVFSVIFFCLTGVSFFSVIFFCLTGVSSLLGPLGF